MALYLVQHGKSLPEEIDPERGLSDEGIREVSRIAEVARGYGIRPTIIRHSGKKRAMQTAEIFAAALSVPKGIEPISGINPLDDVTAAAAQLKTEDNLMLDSLPGQAGGNRLVVHQVGSHAFHFMKAPANQRGCHGGRTNPRIGNSRKLVPCRPERP